MLVGLGEWGEREGRGGLTGTADYEGDPVPGPESEHVVAMETGCYEEEDRKDDRCGERGVVAVEFEFLLSHGVGAWSGFPGVCGWLIEGCL